ncbi:MAG TPA: hypothetical protein VG652_00700 [Gaiellaceae bacterium]|nr:hypothetical protein [Gaiellaceae bacterium]
MLARSRKLGALALVVAVGTTACGGPSAAQRERARHADAQLLLGEVNTRARNAATAEATRETQACNRQIGTFMSALEDLESKISVGLTFPTYTAGVAKIRAAYGALSPSALSGACQAATGAGHTSLNTYISALDTWMACTSTTKCSTDSIAANLQAQWANAAAQTEAAKTALDEVGDNVLAPTYQNAVPAKASAVAGSVYGGVVKFICDAASLPRAAKASCAQLESILQGGVEPSELKDLDSTTSALAVALGLKTATT